MTSWRLAFALTSLAVGACAATQAHEPEPVAIVATPPPDLPAASAPPAQHEPSPVPLDSVRVPFATYLVTMHNRIHPIFAEDFLASLDNLPTTHPLSDPRMFATVEVALAGDDGRLVKVGVLRSSGVTAFDVAVIDSLQRAAPFGKAPESIRSADGNVYVHWEFHRDPMISCSTMNTRPILLR